MTGAGAAAAAAATAAPPTTTTATATTTTTCLLHRPILYRRLEKRFADALRALQLTALR